MRASLYPHDIAIRLRLLTARVKGSELHSLFTLRYFDVMLINNSLFLILEKLVFIANKMFSSFSGYCAAQEEFYALFDFQFSLEPFREIEVNNFDK